MTAAHAFEYEYEVPEHSPAPVEAVERAEHGNVVYLTRHGQRFAAVVPPRHMELDEKVVAVVASVISILARTDPTGARQAVVSLLREVDPSRSEGHRRAHEDLEDLLDDLDNSGLAEERLAEHQAGEPAVSWEQAKRELDL
ncbi:hypothetical protein [Micromonospora sp. NPDC004704]